MAPRLFLSSGDLVADRRYEFARDLQLKGDLPAAAELLEQAIELVPKFPSAWYTLGKVRLELGQREAAIAAFRAARDADPEDRHGAGLHLMQLGVEAVSAMPPGYVQTLFDRYAPRFEAALVGDLGYRGPALLFKAVLSVRASAKKPAFFKRAIDLGCGTGLAAAAFAQHVDRGLGYVDNENSQWGKFTGMTDNGTYGLLDINFLRRDSNTDTWIQLLGRNLGLDSRDLRLEQRRVGDWGYFVEFSQLPYNQPLTILTRTSGIGTPVQFPTGAASLPFAVPYELGTRRDSFTAGVSKALGMGFDVALRYRNETKEGDRRYSNQGSPAFNFLAEPIDYETNQLDAIVSYSGEKFQIQAGYYGTTFDNSNSALWTAAPNFATGANSIALPPDNQSHQGYLSGAYNFTPTTRGNFKVSYSQYTQNEAFFTPAGVGVPAGPFAATSRPSSSRRSSGSSSRAPRASGSIASRRSACPARRSTRWPRRSQPRRPAPSA